MFYLEKEENRSMTHKPCSIEEVKGVVLTRERYEKASESCPAFAFGGSLSRLDAMLNHETMKVEVETNNLFIATDVWSGRKFLVGVAGRPGDYYARNIGEIGIRP